MTKAFPDKVSLEAQILNDLEFVRNAIFTEPADQSAWLYQRFLLGNDVEPVLLLNVLFGITGDSKLLVLKFNQKVKYVKSGIFSEIHIIKLESSNVEVIFELGAFHGNILGLASGKITFPLPTTTVNNSKFTTIEFMQLKGGTPTSELSKQPDSIWIQELSHIEELVEVEPDSKWALLTLLEFYQHLNKDSKVVLELLERLSTIDPFRKGYYNDIRSDIMLKTKLLEVPGNGDYINLSGMGLSRLQPHLPFVTATEINLSNNSLSKIDFSYFISVKKLYLDNNRMACLDGIDHLKDLQELYIQNNRNIRLNA